MKRTQVGLISLALFLTGIGLRLPGLSGYLTPDEHLWAGRTAQFMLALGNQDWRATNTSGHPGVTTTWAGSLGVTLRWLFDRPADAASLRAMAESLAADTTSLAYLPWLRLPIILLCAVGGVLFFLLSRRLLGDAVAVLAALLALLDPFWLAHSKIIHLDALLTLTVTLAWLLLMLATRTHRRALYVAAGIAIGLGILTKSPALALGPLMVGWLLFDRFSATAHARGERRWLTAFGDTIVDCLWVGIPAALVITLLWPAMWVAPLDSIRRVLGLMGTYSQTGHELGNFWLGQAVASPGWPFYGAVILWRTTPITLIGVVLALVSTLVGQTGRSGGFSRFRTLFSLPQKPTEASNPMTIVDVRRALWGLWLFVAWYIVILSLGDKKFDRYLLPVFLTLDLLAAFGWVALVVWWQRRRNASTVSARLRPPRAWYALISVLLIVQGGLVYAAAPSYLTAYNPLLGGMRTARQVMLVGWGEGLEEAAAFINEREGASGARVSSWYGCNVFAPFLHGDLTDICYETPTPADLYREDIDYVVTYVNQIQRELLNSDVAAQLGAPLYIVRHAGVEQAWVYDWPKPYVHTGDRTLSDGWRLMGWEISPQDPGTNAIRLTLFWDQGALTARTDPTQPVTAWIKDATGEVWAVVEAVVTGEENTVPGWSGEPDIVQPITLQSPPGLPPGVYRVEVAPFAAQSTDLSEIIVAPQRLSDLTANPDMARALNLADADVRFGDELALVGYEIVPSDEETIVDLLWAVEKTPATAYKTFLHLVDADGRIAAQQDSCLGGATQDAACSPMTGWSAGDVIRQRLRLPLAQGEGQFYVGLYHPETEERLPLSAGEQVVPDGRYLLPGLNPESAP